MESLVKHVQFFYVYLKKGFTYEFKTEYRPLLNKINNFYGE